MWKLAELTISILPDYQYPELLIAAHNWYESYLIYIYNIRVKCAAATCTVLTGHHFDEVCSRTLYRVFNIEKQYVGLDILNVNVENFVSIFHQA